MKQLMIDINTLKQNNTKEITAINKEQTKEKQNQVKVDKAVKDAERITKQIDKPKTNKNQNNSVAKSVPPKKSPSTYQTTAQDEAAMADYAKKYKARQAQKKEKEAQQKA